MAPCSPPRCCAASAWATVCALSPRCCRVASSSGRTARASSWSRRCWQADEPTGTLDFATGETVMELMFALNRERYDAVLVRTTAARSALYRQLRIEAAVSTFYRRLGTLLLNQLHLTHFRRL